MYKFFFKRFLDYFISLIAIIILLPFLIIITIWLHFANKGAGVFFLQQRPGKNEKIFKVIKFKTMSDEKDINGNLLPDENRLTVVGKIVRKTSLDEIPQLINVIKGDMSLIGPRPLLIRYLPYYTDKERVRHSVRPGITGLAQINGRNLLNWDARLSLDVKYVKDLNFLLDLKTFLHTILNVILSKDIAVNPESIFKSLDDERKLSI